MKRRLWILTFLGFSLAIAAGCGVPALAPALLAEPEGQVDTGEPPSSAPYFALDHVLDIAVEMAPADWDALRRQTRTLDDWRAESKAHCLAQPFANIYSWFPAKVTVDGETHTDVGVRKKGFVGSQSKGKPALKIRFDKYVAGQTLGGVLERMTLNNGIQDPSLIRTCLAYQVFAAAGVPAPRCNFATVAVNGENRGLYIHVEDIRSLVERTFASAQGNLYEGMHSDFRPEWRGTFEKKTNQEIDDWSDIDAVVAALQDPSDAALGDAVDLDRFLTFWATEGLIRHWDGYAGNRSNYWFYREPDGLFVFMPWGVDLTFAHDALVPPVYWNLPPSVLAHGILAYRLYHDDAQRTAYVDRLQELLATVWNEEELLQSIDEMADIVQQHALLSQLTPAAADTEQVRRFVRERRSDILADLTPEPPDWPHSLLPGVCQRGGWSMDRSEDPDLLINEVAARGAPLDWFELYNASDHPIDLSDFVFADDLTDLARRIPFPADMILEPGAYVQVELDKAGWPGFALGSDEELGIWTVDGILVAHVDWAEGQAGEGMSFARVPDITGPFQTVSHPTPGAPN